MRIGRDRVRQILRARGSSFQRTRTRKELTQPTIVLSGRKRSLFAGGAAVAGVPAGDLLGAVVPGEGPGGRSSG